MTICLLRLLEVPVFGLIGLIGAKAVNTNLLWWRSDLQSRWKFSWEVGVPRNPGSSHVRQNVGRAAAERQMSGGVGASLWVAADCNQDVNEVFHRFARIDVRTTGMIH